MKKKENENIRYCVVVMGSSGVGKSSIIKIHCGIKVIVGHGVNAVTQGSELFEDTDELYKGVRQWMDTQGALDTNATQTDRETLSKIIKKNYMKKILIILK